ncbi:ECU03_0255 [Encephalitozoon cuniculi GB-M1]|uniref:ECU03_0255 protein n=1 Tax=Encephalitozoon cuniculi (strain GB-M1) TaxID=284813 RepID=A0A1T5PCR7_ENCCU|nr:uncharacterized protein ECU03_0255 [Encephalitozoon cuniculi GB-M1]SKD10686.1 ECU03_0255 [Encephalitozoon cuniculi GB-M1]
MSTTKQEIQSQMEHADNLFEEMNRKMETLKGKLLNLSKMVDSINKKIEDMSMDKMA